MPANMTFKIVSKASEKVLDVAGGSLDDRGQVIQSQDHDGASQLWNVFIPSASPGFVIQNFLSGKILDVFGGSLDDLAAVIQFQFTHGLNQQWKFINSPLDGDNGLCHIVSLASGKRLDVEGLSFDNGARIVQFGQPLSPLQVKTQSWKLVLAGISSGKPQGVRSQLTALVLDVSGGSLEDGAPIIQFEDNGGLSQRWLFEPVGGGFFKIISLASGKVLDVSGGSLEDGAPIIQFEDNGGLSQQWQLVAEVPLNDRLFVFKFMNRSSGKVLSLAPGASSQQIVQKSLLSFDVSLAALQWTLFEDSVLTDDVLVALGKVIVNQDPLAVQLRGGLPDAPSQRGFNIAFGFAGGDKLPGPGKDTKRDSLPLAQREGFNTAVSYFLLRNFNIEFATTGAAIAKIVPKVAEARTSETNAFFSLGFDIATGIFGDPALGAQGDTNLVLGPGQTRIRDSLNDPGKRGFDASQKLHLGPPPLPRQI